MSPSTEPSAKRFELEALEPRVLLSGDPAGAAVLDPLVTDPSLASIVEEQLDSDPAQAQADQIAYDPAAQVDGIFEGVAEDESSLQSQANPAGEEDQEQARAPSNESSEADAESEHSAPTLGAADASNAVEDQPADDTASSADCETLIEQLTETLRVANAPPDDALEGNAEQEHAQYVNGAAAKKGGGISLNGRPLERTEPGEMILLGEGGVLSGSGVVDTPMAVGGTLSPGNSPGRLG